MKRTKPHCSGHAFFLWMIVWILSEEICEPHPADGIIFVSIHSYTRYVTLLIVRCPVCDYMSVGAVLAVLERKAF